MISAWQLHQAAQKIRKGAIIAYPTEAVWGLGCDPWNALAVQKILRLKQRSQHKGLILVAAHKEQFSSLLKDLPTSALIQLENSWPGPNTWLIPHQQRLPAWITGQHKTVALRVSDHPVIQALCRITGPLVSTSANPSGHSATTSRLRLEQYFHGRLDAVLNAPLGQQQQPTIIRDLLSGAIIRA